MLNLNVSGRCLLCNNQIVCTVIYDNHRATSSCETCKCNSLLNLECNYEVYYPTLFFHLEKLFKTIYQLANHGNF